MPGLAAKVARILNSFGVSGTCSPPKVARCWKGDIVDKGVGFAAGGDDYMVKPFDPRELRLEKRVRARGLPAGLGIEAVADAPD